MAFLALAVLFAVAGAGAWLFIVLHAFRRSVGTGFLVLLIPVYLVWYAFSQFEHRNKGVVLATWLGCCVLSAVLYSSVAAQLQPKVVDNGADVLP